MSSHGFDLVATLLGAMSVATALGWLALRAGLSPIVGYLVAGIVVGPFTPGFVAHAGVASQLAEVGIVLMMFGVGVNLHVRDLLAVRAVAVPGAIVAVSATAALGVVIARTFGHAWQSAVTLGLAVSVSSTVVLLRALAERGELQSAVGRISVGWLVVEDMLTVAALMFLPGLAATGHASRSAWLVAASATAVKIALLGLATVVLSRGLVPRVMHAIARTRSRELFTLTVLVFALGVAVAAHKLLGVSLALGAFLAGLAVGPSEFGPRAGAEAVPLRDAFAVLFFVSVGMALDPRALRASGGAAAAALFTACVFKPLVAYGVLRARGQSPSQAAMIAAGLGQLGEFSFVVVALGAQFGWLEPGAAQGIVLASIVSITSAPWLRHVARAFAARVSRRAARAGARRDPDTRAPIGGTAHHAIVVGHGPVGRQVTRILSDYGIAPTVVDLNPEAVASLRRAGVRAVHGDASQPEVLDAAGLATARALILTASNGDVRRVVRVARELRPDLVVMARATYVREAAELRASGVDVVVAAEAEVGLSFAEQLLTSLGASGEQLDRARDRVREEFARPLDTRP